MVNSKKLRLKWNSHSSNFMCNLGDLLVSEQYSDVTLCCQGKVWHLHQLVLSASSSHFADLLRFIPSGQTPILILDGPTAADLRALIHFIYHGEVNVDQESLPSVLRTAASLRIKGLTDIGGHEGDTATGNVSDRLNHDILIRSQGLSDNCIISPVCDNLEDISPLNLSCNKAKKHHLEDNDCDNGYKPTLTPLEKKDSVSVNDRSQNYYPVTKKLRNYENREETSSVINHIKSPPIFNITESNLEKDNRNMNENQICNSNSVLCTNSQPDIMKNHLLRIGQPMEVIPESFRPRIYSSEKDTYPIADLPSSMNQTYQKSSISPSKVNILSSSLSIVASDPGAINLITSKPLCKLKSPFDTIVLPVKSLNRDFYVQLSQHVQTPGLEINPSTTSVLKVSPPDQKLSPSDICEKTLPDESQNNSIQEKPFNHKKFSACYALTQTNKNIINQQDKKCANSQISCSNDIKLESNRDVLQTESLDLRCKNSEISSSNNVSSSALYTTSEDIVNDLSNKPNSDVNLQFKLERELLSPSEPNKVNLDVKYSDFSQEVKNLSDSSSFVSTTQESVVNNQHETNNNSSRVSVNMRTFKEEWRKQLLVDYNTRTNMSICMICFTTFKSYDGPRKNTYVKHAKRFHPALEGYSEEERDVIISMYEKYHKYDIDMQKEINKSFRNTNGPGNSLRRIKLSETVLSNSILTSNLTRVDVDNDSSEERDDSSSECKSADEGSCSKDDLAPHGEPNVYNSLKDTQIEGSDTIVNNNNFSENNNCKVGDPVLRGKVGHPAPSIPS